MYRSGNSVPSVGQSVESTVRDQIQDFCMNFNTGNYDQCVSLFLPDGFLLAPNQDMVQGSRLIQKVLEGYTDRGYGDLRMETVRVDASSDMAAEIGRYTQSIHLSNGTTVVDRGKYVNVWRRLGVWRIMTACWSSNLPAVLDKSVAAGSAHASKNNEDELPDEPESA
jgi:ketosteroid isomerase-like protein